MRTVKDCQLALIEAGYDVGPDGADNVFGGDTQKALLLFQADHGLETTGTFDHRTQAVLFPKPKGSSTMNSNWLSGLVASTAFKYFVAMVATFIASKLGLDKGSVEGILTQALALAMAIWGMWEASRNKIVLDGTKVKVSDLTGQQKATVKAIVADNKG